MQCNNTASIYYTCMTIFSLSNMALSLPLIALLCATIFVMLMLTGAEQHMEHTSIDNQGTHVVQNSVEGVLRDLEMKRFDQITTRLRDNGYTIHGFYHTSAWKKHWRSVIEEQMQIMEGARIENGRYINNHSYTGILDVVDKLHMTVAGDETSFDVDKNKVTAAVKQLKLRNEQKIIIKGAPTLPRSAKTLRMSPSKIEAESKKGLTSGEVSTINELHAFCKKKKDAGEKALVFYLHNKGGCCPKYSNTPVEHWRDLMNAFVIEFPSICLRALSAGYSACGPEYQDSHYSGNFWWADCDHVGALEPLSNMFDAYAAEFFIWKVNSANDKYATHCGYNPFHCRADHYHDMCPRSKYLPTIFESLISPGLPPNPTASINNSIEYARDHCPMIRNVPFYDQDQRTRNSWWQ